jgi:flavin-dependent dehydrogenase
VIRESESHFDVAIIGGGPAGSAAAIILARARRRVLMIEKASQQTFKVGESLPSGVLPLLQELRVQERFVADGHLASYGNQSAWGSEQLQSTDFIRDPNGIGWHLNRPVFDSMLRDAARESGADVAGETLVTGAERDQAGGWSLSLNTGESSQKISAEWVIDCTGRRSWFARREGVRRESYDRMIAFVSVFARANVTDLEPDLDSLTLIESVKDGWWYTSLIPGGQRVVIFFTDADRPAARRARYVQGFLALLGKTVHLRNRLGDLHYTICGSPAATSADTGRLERVVGDRWLAAGDACTSFDPLSSQGILNALYSGLKAGSALNSHLEGDTQALTGYSDNVNAVFDAYLKNRLLFYSYEQRWPRNGFWKARLGTQD